MAVVGVEVGGLMYETCEIQTLNGMEWVLPGAGGARDKGAEDERVPSHDMWRHGARTRTGGTREGHKSARAAALSVRKTPEGRETRTGKETRGKREG